jgi:hypothetical protein
MEDPLEMVVPFGGSKRISRALVCCGVRRRRTETETEERDRIIFFHTTPCRLKQIKKMLYTGIPVPGTVYITL